MPQFDFTTYTSQLFWFALCFITLYIFVSRIILPRITNILNNRQNIIEKDISLAKALDLQARDIETKVEELRKMASSTYQTKLDVAAKTSQKEREDLIEKLKEKLNNDAKESRQKLRDFVANSKAGNENLIKNLVQIIKEKILKNV